MICPSRHTSHHITSYHIISYDGVIVVKGAGCRGVRWVYIIPNVLCLHQGLVLVEMEVQPALVALAPFADLHLREFRRGVSRAVDNDIRANVITVYHTMPYHTTPYHMTYRAMPEQRVDNMNSCTSTTQSSEHQ